MYKPNYENYSLDELNEALDSIDSEASPENYQKLMNGVKLRNGNRKQSDKVINKKEDEVHTKNSSHNEYLTKYWDPKTAKEAQKSIVRRLAIVKLFIIVGVLSLPAYFNSYLIDESYNLHSAHLRY